MYDQTSSHRYAYKRYSNLPTDPPSRLDPLDNEYRVADMELRLLQEERRRSVLEMSKDGWNREVEGFVRGLYTTDWRNVRERMERGAIVTWDKMRNALAQAAAEGKEVAQEKS